MAPSTEPLVARARRLGPLPYSSLPGGVVGAVGAGSDSLAGWEADLAGWEADLADRWWEAAGRPDPYTLVEVGAGDGSRARAVLELGPQCLAALRMVLVEPAYEDSHRSLLPVEEPAFLFPAGSVDPDDPEGGPVPAVGIGPLATSVPDLPVLEGVATVVLSGWLSRMPSDRFEWRGGKWWEVRLAAGGESGGAGAGAAEGGAAGAGLPPGLVEMLVPVDELPVTVGWEPHEGQRVARLGGAADCLAEALRTAPAGVVVALDRWTTTTGPLVGGGVPEVALDQLAVVRAPLDPVPVPVLPGWSMVTWRLG